MTPDYATGRVAYPGLRAFGREEFDLFFGRESCVDEMVDTLGRTCFLAVLGTSGSGKSSLVRTGLLNALELGFLAAAGSTWRIAELRPRGQPIRSLAMALLSLQGQDQPEEAEIEILSAFLRRGPRSLIEWANSGHLPPRANLMVLVDQFEELFRYEDYSGREEAEAFVGLLVTAAREDVPIYVAITMRSEYLGACTLIEGLPEVINRGLYLTPRMSREECRQAIVGPAEVCGFRIEDRLVNKLLNDLTDFAPWDAGGGHDQQRRLGRRADQLPLMQHVLNLLWQKARSRNQEDIVLTLSDYEQAGGLGGALDRHADDVATGVPPQHADVIDTVFRALVTGKTVADAVRRPTRFGELVELAGGRRESVAAVVDAFRGPGVNFLTPGQPETLNDGTFVDISHESLIRQWRRLSRCLDEEAHSADAWNQLLSRAERYKAGSGGLLTGLDLDNLLDWWERARPTAAWAARYGNNFDEARTFLWDSQKAEAERKRADEEEERQLIAAQEAARTGRRFKRLAAALAAALIVAFAATGAAIYLWRQSNAEALAALEAQQEADRQRAIAEAALAEAEEQRAIAESEAAAAEAARLEADEQRAIAEAQRLDAERARAEAEAAEQEAILARQQADEIIDTSIAYFAKSLGDRVAVIHGDPSHAEDIGLAGGLLARLAADTRPAIAPGVEPPFLAALRPAFVVQDALAGASVPQVASGPADVTWTDPPGGPGLTGAMDWSGKTIRVSDRTGRVIARHEIPPSFWGALAGTPFAAAVSPRGDPVTVLADTAGQVWIGTGGTGPLAVAEGAAGVGRIDDLSVDPAGDRVYLAYSRDPADASADPGQSRFGSGMRIAVFERRPDGWRAVANVRIPPGPLDGLGGPAGAIRLAGVADELLYAAADGGLVRSDLMTGRAGRIDLPGVVLDAGLVPGGRLLLVGGARDDDGRCFRAASGKTGMIEPWLRPDPTAPIKAAITVEPGDDAAVGPAAPAAPAIECLLLVDTGSLEPVWWGESEGARFDTLRAAGDAAEGIEIVEGTGTSDLKVLRVLSTPQGWREEVVAFDRGLWGLGAFSDAYAGIVAAGAALPPLPTPAGVHLRVNDGVIGRLASPGPGRPLAVRIGEDEVQVATVLSGLGSFGSGAETTMDVVVYKPDQDGFSRDPRIDARRIGCQVAGDGSCRFDAAAFSPDGNWLLATSGGRHVFVGRAGPVGDWQPNAVSEGDKSAATELTLTALAPLDRQGRSFVGLATDGGLRLISRPAAPAWSPGFAEDRQFRQAPRQPDTKSADSGQKAGEGSGGTGGLGGGGSSTITEIRLPGHVVSDLAGLATDPARGMLYIWGPRIGLRAMPKAEGDMLLADVNFPAPVADVAALADGNLVVATTDGQVMIVQADRFRPGGSSSIAEAASPEAVATGLGAFGAIDVWANDDSIVLRAGVHHHLIDGTQMDAASAAADPANADNSRLRSLGFRIDEAGRIEPAFVVPWEHIAGQLASGVAVSTLGEVLETPPALPADEQLLALTIMREERTAEETPELEIGFDMLHMRVAGDGGETVSDCGWIIGVAVMMAGDLQENIGEEVRRACDEPATTAAVVNAIFDDRLDQRIGTLIRFAPASPLAFAVLTSSLRPVAPEAAKVLASIDTAAVQEQWEQDLAAIAESGPIPLRAVDPAKAGVDPFSHWILAMEAERGNPDAAGLSEALFHYAYAERLFEAAHVRVPAPVVKRRIALARILSDETVYDVFRRLEAAPRDPAEAGLSEARLEPVPLADVAKWLGDIAGQDEEAGKRLNVLTALVEEMTGDELAGSDRDAAARHYRKAVGLITASEEALSRNPGTPILGRIEAVETIGAKLAAIGDETATADAAAAVLGMVDAALPAPVHRDVDPPELRDDIERVMAVLAGAGRDGFDLSRFRDFRFSFLDHDWESRYQAINQVGAERFYRELETAETFLTAALDQARPEDRPHWLALRGRTRFWLSTLDGEQLPYDGATFRGWLDSAVADFTEAGGPEQIGAWDASLIGNAYSRMIELAPFDAEVAGLVEKSAAAFDNVLAREEFLDLDSYRQRLIYDGYMLALERAMVRLRGDPFLGGFAAQPGEPAYDRRLLAELGFEALDLARRREALRIAAEFNGLLETNSSWSLDNVGDFYWGATVSQLGAMLRLESGANGAPTPCDTVASHPFDVTRRARSVGFDELDTGEVMAACAGSASRELIHRARALIKADMAPPDEIMRLLLPGARENLPIAYNILSILVNDAGGTTEETQDLMTTFSQLGLVLAYPEIAALLKAEQRRATDAETFEWLAAKAADLGVPEAFIDLAELTPDVLTGALNLTIARNLYAAQGRTAEADAIQARLDALNMSNTNIADTEAAASARRFVAIHRLDDALEQRIDDLLWDARSQASLR
jgi:hypothetical protein